MLDCDTVAGLVGCGVFASTNDQAQYYVRIAGSVPRHFCEKGPWVPAREWERNTTPVKRNRPAENEVVDEMSNVEI